MSNRLKFPLLLLLLLIVPGGNAQTAKYPVTVVLPVEGNLVLPIGDLSDRKLLNINTSSGDVQLIASGRNLTLPIWNVSGTKLMYKTAQIDAAFYDTLTQTSQTIESFGSAYIDDIFFPVGWAQNESNAIYLGLTASTLDLYEYNLTVDQLNLLTSFQTQVPLTGVPLPLESGELILAGLSQFARNPVFDDWIALQFAVVDPTLQTPGVYVETYVTVLWGYTTAQMISLDTLAEERLLPDTLDWSHDGKSLILSGYDRGAERLYLVSFREDGVVGLLDSGIVPSDRNIDFLFDAGNLLLAFGLNPGTNRIDYYIGEMINGTWHEREFIRLDDDTYRSFSHGDWYLRASVEEKKTLSCLFDQTMAARLVVGESGQVTSAGAPASLRLEPGTHADVLVELPEAAGFEVMATPECRNGYRWWQIQLSDGTVGYTAEADIETYFLAPTE